MLTPSPDASSFRMEEDEVENCPFKYEILFEVMDIMSPEQRQERPFNLF